jgi:hypothetical protein
MREHSATMRKRHAEILKLVDCCHRLNDAIKQERLAAPTRN